MLRPELIGEHSFNAELSLPKRKCCAYLRGKTCAELMEEEKIAFYDIFGLSMYTRKHCFLAPGYHSFLGQLYL